MPEEQHVAPITAPRGEVVAVQPRRTQRQDIAAALKCVAPVDAVVNEGTIDVTESKRTQVGRIHRPS